MFPIYSSDTIIVPGRFAMQGSAEDPGHLEHAPAYFLSETVIFRNAVLVNQRLVRALK